MGALIAANYTTKAMGNIFIGFFDKVGYTLLYAAYDIFSAVAHLNLFGGDVEAAMNIYNTFTANVYRILAIAMVFFFAYQLILLIINPEGEASKQTSRIVKNTVVSFIFIAICPTIFKYMALLQEHIVDESTITTIVLGTNGATAGNSAGKHLTIITFLSMYHPEGTNYNTFYVDGELASDAATRCVSEGSASQDVCDDFVSALSDWEADIANGDENVTAITSRESLRDTLLDEGGMDYQFLLSTICAVGVALFLASYALDMGTRAIKLGFLEIIAPIPLVMCIFPQTEKTFKTWLKEMEKTYLDIYMRLLLISFMIQMCILVPDFINVIFNANNGVQGGKTVQTLAVVVLIFGLLSFAKEAPKLIKDLFTTGGLFDGMNLKPGITKRVKENTAASKAIGFGVGAVAGGAANAVRSGKASYNQSKAAGDTDTASKRFSSVMKAIGAGAAGTARGTMAGAAGGFKNDSGNILKDIKTGAKAGSTAGYNKDQKMADGASWWETTAPGAFMKDKGKELSDTWKTLTGDGGFQNKNGQILGNASTILGNVDAKIEASPEYKALIEAQTEKLKEAYKNRDEKLSKMDPTTDEYKQAKFESDTEISSLLQRQADARSNAKAEILARDEYTKDGARAAIEQLSKLMKDHSSVFSDDLSKKIAKSMGISEVTNLKDLTDSLDKMSKDKNADPKAIAQAISAKDDIQSAAFASQAKQQAKDAAKQGLEDPKPQAPANGGGDKK